MHLAILHAPNVLFALDKVSCAHQTQIGSPLHMLNRLVDCRFMPKPFFDGVFRICVQENAAKIVWMFLTIEIRPTNAPIEYCYATRLLQLLDDKINRNHGVAMAVVQAYYPHKSDMLAALATALNDIVMQATLPFCRQLAIRDESTRKVAHLFLAGSAYFEFMQQNEERRAYFTELLRNRDHTEQLMFSVMNRSFGEIGRTDVIEDPAHRNDIVMSIGGFFELFYDHLKRGERFEPTRYFGHMTRVWMHAAGFSRQQADEVLEQCTVELEHIDRISTDVERAFALLLQA